MLTSSVKLILCSFLNVCMVLQITLTIFSLFVLVKLPNTDLPLPAYFLELSELYQWCNLFSYQLTEQEGNCILQCSVFSLDTSPLN